MFGTVAGFDWDDGNWPKCSKHGVSRAEIEALFIGRCDVYPDPAHAQTEDRMLAIGRVSQRFMLVAFTLRERKGKILIRPISARYMHRKEVENFERQGQA